MTEQIAVPTLGTDDLLGLRVPLEGDGPVDGTDLRVGGINPAVDHGHDNPGTGGPSPRPVLVDGQIDPRHRP
jgi:hypothetical protein